ncbi:MAG: response regulator [Solirubrobacterales bacterium]
MDAVWIALIVFAFAFLALVILVVRFPEEIRDLIRRTDKVEVRPTGVAWQAYRQAIHQKERREPSRAVAGPVLGRISGGRILWVDDSPVNNRLEARALQAQGVEVDFAISNDEAVEYAEAEDYNLVISDIGRRAPESATAGLELPARLPRSKRGLPIVYYTGYAEAPQTPSGYPVFDKPSELFEFIAEQLGGADRKNASSLRRIGS